MTDTNIVAVVPKSLVSKDVPMKTVELEKQKEFRFDIEFDQTVVIKVSSQISLIGFSLFVEQQNFLEQN